MSGQRRGLRGPDWGHAHKDLVSDSGIHVKRDGEQCFCFQSLSKWSMRTFFPVFLPRGFRKNLEEPKERGLKGSG